MAVIVWDVERAAIPYVVVSGLLELAYIALLAAAYERVPLSIVYPVARGTAPVLVLCSARCCSASTRRRLRWWASWWWRPA